MSSTCNESLVGRLGEGNIDERGGEEIKDNREVHKETARATCYFLQGQGEVQFVDAWENQIWIELHNGGLFIVN
jgi:hypothetical protein